MRRQDVLLKFQEDFNLMEKWSQELAVLKESEPEDMPNVFEYLLGKFKDNDFDYIEITDCLLKVALNYYVTALMNTNYGDITLCKMKQAIDRVIKVNYNNKQLDLNDFDIDEFNSAVKDYIKRFGYAYEKVREVRIKKLFNDLETVQILVNKFYETIEFGNREGDKVNDVMRRLELE